MVITQRSRLFRFTMFASLYFVQGVLFAYTSNFQKPYLDGFGIDADLIGVLVSLALLPFVLKIGYGVLSDRVNLFGRGHRLPYIFVGVTLSAVAIASISFISPANQFVLYAIFVLLAAFSVALFDTTADGLAIDTTPNHDQSLMQGVMTGGRALGLITLSLIFGVMAQKFGYQTVFITVSICMFLPLLWVIQVREPNERSHYQKFEWSAFASLLKPVFLIFALYAIANQATLYAIDGLVTYSMSQQLGALETQIGTYGGLKGIGIVLGALLTSVLFRRFGRPVAFTVTVLISLGGLVFGSLVAINSFLIMGLLWGILMGSQETIFLTLAMKRTDARIAGTMFAIMMALSNIGIALGDGIATGLTDDIGFSSVFRLIAAVNLVVIPLLWVVFATPATDPSPPSVANSPI